MRMTPTPGELAAMGVEGKLRKLEEEVRTLKLQVDILMKTQEGLLMSVRLLARGNDD